MFLVRLKRISDSVDTNLELHSLNKAYLKGRVIPSDLCT